MRMGEERAIETDESEKMTESERNASFVEGNAT